MSKSYIFITLVIRLLTGCVFSERKDLNENQMPFEGIEFQSIDIYQDENQDYRILKDTFLKEKFTKKLRNLKSKELIKNKGQHGAKNIYSFKVVKEGNDLILFMNRTKEDQITIDFFEESNEDNFNYFLETYYDSEEIYKLFENRFRKVEIDN